MAQTYTTGAVLFYGLSPAQGSRPLFIGTAERYPRSSIRPGWEPVYNDLGGQKVPFEILYEGEEAFVSFDLTRWNENLHAMIANRPAGTLAGRGGNLTGQIGTAMLLEKAAWVIWLVFPFATKAAYRNAANGALPAGYRFPAAIPIGPDDFISMGTAARKIRLVFHCLRAFLPSLSTGLVAGMPGLFTLYDHNVSGLPGID